MKNNLVGKYFPDNDTVIVAARLLLMFTFFRESVSIYSQARIETMKNNPLG